MLRHQGSRERGEPEQDQHHDQQAAGRHQGERYGLTGLSTIWPPRSSTPPSSPCSGVVTVSDLRTRLVPDAALVASMALALPVCLLSDPGGVPERLLAGSPRAGFLLAAALIRPDGMGLGDVKLAGVLGLYLGGRDRRGDAGRVRRGSVAGLFLLARHGWSARGRTIPFAPFLAIGALVALAAQP